MHAFGSILKRAECLSCDSDQLRVDAYSCISIMTSSDARDAFEALINTQSDIIKGRLVHMGHVLEMLEDVMCLSPSTRGRKWDARRSLHETEKMSHAAGVLRMEEVANRRRTNISYNASLLSNVRCGMLDVSGTCSAVVNMSVDTLKSKSPCWWYSISFDRESDIDKRVLISFLLTVYKCYGSSVVPNHVKRRCDEFIDAMPCAEDGDLAVRCVGGGSEDCRVGASSIAITSHRENVHELPANDGDPVPCFCARCLVC